MTEPAHRTLGRYEIRQEIGRGMMGVVYEALDPALGRTIALKTIELGFTLSPKERENFEQRFLVEARIAARLSHPGIVVIHDVGRDAGTGTLFMALEYLQGRTLAEVLKRGPGLEWREALRITLRLAEALDHAHSHGVIHRDIKPGNVMLLRTGEPKVMDFGIARAETTRIHITAAGQSLGTPLYMSPEQALGEAVDRRTDLFSLGAIAYSLLTGRPAFWAESMTKIIARVIEDDPPPPSQIAPGLPGEVDRIIAHALAKSPSDRYPDAKSLTDDLEDVLSGRQPRHTAPSQRAPAEPEAPGAPEPEGIGLEHLLEEGTHARSEADLPTVDLDAQLGTLVEPPQPADARDASGRRSGAARAPTLRPALPSTLWGRWLPREIEAWGLGLLLVLGLGVVAAVFLGRASGPVPEAEPSSGRVRSEPRPSQGSPRGAPTIEPARLSIDLDTSVDHCLVRIWVDRELIVEQRLGTGGGGSVGAFDFRGRGVQESLELAPGGHDVEIQVAWDGKEKTERIWGHFDEGSTRRLRARLGGLFKRLSLEWR